MVAKNMKTGFVVKSALLGASMLTLAGMASAQAGAPAATATPVPAVAPAEKIAPTQHIEKTDKVEKTDKTEKAVKTDKVSLAPERGGLSAAADAAFQKVKTAAVGAGDGVAKDGKALLAAVDDEIAAVKKKYDGASAEAKEHWAKQSAALKASRDKLAMQLDKLSAAAADGWDAARKGVENAYHDVSATVAAALGKVKA